MKKKTLGIILIVFPWVVLPLAIAGYAITRFILAMDETSVALTVIVGKITSNMLGLAGLAAILGFFIGIPVGLYLVFKNENAVEPKA